MQRKLEEEARSVCSTLQQLGVRRISQMGLARGWTAWLDNYQEYQYKKRLLKGAGARLAKPKLVASFVKWRHDWESEEAAKAMMTTAQRIADADAKRVAVEVELEQVRSELKKAREDMLAGRGMEAERERLMQEELEREREKRVAHLQQIGVRRLMQQGLARGWTAWLEVYEDYVHKKRMLKTAASRLSKPKLVASFVKWQRDWEAEEAAKGRMTQEQRVADAEASRAAAEAEAAKLRDELAKARDDMLAGRGQEAERERLLQEQLAAEREKRVAHLQQLGVRRLMQQGLARGWTAWLDIYLDYQHKKRMLKTAASRLAKPKLVASFVHWQRDWEAEEAGKAKQTSRDRRAAELAERDVALQEIQEQNDELRMKLAAAEAALRSRKGEAFDSMEAEMQRKLEEEREKRVQHLQQLGVRRISQMGLARGWTAWHDNYQEYQYKKRLLKGAAGRLAKPSLWLHL